MRSPGNNSWKRKECGGDRRPTNAFHRRLLNPSDSQDQQPICSSSRRITNAELLQSIDAVRCELRLQSREGGLRRNAQWSSRGSAKCAEGSAHAKHHCAITFERRDTALPSLHRSRWLYLTGGCRLRCCSACERRTHRRTQQTMPHRIAISAPFHRGCLFAFFCLYLINRSCCLV